MNRLAIACISFILIGCRKEDMAQQPRLSPHEPSSFSSNGNSARPLVPGSVARNGRLVDTGEYRRVFPTTRAVSVDPITGAGDFPADFPRSGEPLRRALERGRARYSIYCSVCHGDTGAGDGMIVQRGFIRPPAYYPIAAHARENPDLFRRETELRTAAPAYIYDTITNGRGAMYSYASRVSPPDRWAIAAYIQALQLSQGVDIASLPMADRQAIAPTTQGDHLP